VLYALISGYYVFEQTPILGREPDLTPGS
jgi:hypothetical protein